MELSTISDEYEYIRWRVQRIAEIMLATIEYNNVENQDYIDDIMEANSKVLDCVITVVEKSDHSQVKEFIKVISESATVIANRFYLLDKHEKISTGYNLQIIQRHVSDIHTLAVRAEQIQRGLTVYRPT